MKRSGMLCGLVVVLAFSPAAFAGRWSGPGLGSGFVPANGTLVYHEYFVGGQPASVQFTGDGSTVLDAYIFDPSGRLVVYTFGPGDRGRVSWTPPRPGRYRIEIRNSGWLPNFCTVRTN